MLATGKFSFGEYELDCDRRLLTRAGEPLNLYPKAFDLLEHLVENRGRAVSKDELLERVWPGQFVEENNLTVQVSAQRKTFGDTNVSKRFIATIPGKGYKFVADVSEPIRDGEIVVETHKIQRIVVEQGVEKFGKNDPWLKKYRTAIALVLAGAMLAGIGGYAARNRLFAGFGGDGPFVQHRARQLTTNGNVGMAALSPDGKLFAYTIDDLGKKSLWLGYIDGGNHLQLRGPSDAAYRSLTFSPDNTQLYYSLRDDKEPKAALMKIPVLGGLQEKVLDNVGTFSLSPDAREIALVRPSGDDDNRVNVSIMPLDGSPGRDIAAFDKSQRFLSTTLSWTKDKTKLATVLVAEDKLHAELAVIEVATGSVATLRHEMLREVTKTAWLSDGTGLIVTAVELNSNASVPHYRLFQIDYPSGKIHPITSDRSQYGESWHNDAGVSLGLSDASDALLSVEHRQVNNIWLARADDLTDRRQITFGSFGKYDGLWGLDWTPDGKLIYTTSDTESQFIAEINPDGSGQKQITAGGKVDSSLSVTADGKYIVFHSNRAPDFSIWRSDIDGSNAKQLTSGGEAFQPTASPDGRFVYFKSYIGESRGALCRVPLDGGEPECFTKNETSFPSFSPDGKYIAAAYKTDKTRLAIFSAADHSIVRQIEIPKNASPFIGIKWKPDSRTFTVRDASSGYWNFPVDGDPYKLAGLPEERLYNFSWSRDGKWLAFTRGQEIRDVVILQTRLKRRLSSDKALGSG
jgi:DNA-binding winged helix-turn-helix (wHTH) protein/Tol biopolymer transport system component